MLVKPITLDEAITAAAHELTLAGITDPRLNAELLAAHLLGLWTRAEVRQRYHDPLSQQDLDRYQSFIRRRLRHEPLQYITGETEFFGLRLYTAPGVLIPRPDTEILIEETLKEAAPDARILDIGTGSGCIALALASRLPNATIVGIDLSADAIQLARKNQLRLGLTNVEFKNADVMSEENINSLGKFDIVVSNPPYIPVDEYETLDREVIDFEPRGALTDDADGLTFYKQIITIAPKLLRSGGRLLLEVGYGGAERVAGIASNLRYLRTAKDLAGIERVILWDESNLG